jgi:Zn-dependent protease
MENGYFKIGRFGGAPIRIHWSTPIGAIAFCGFQFTRYSPAAWATFVLLILVHELGHAALVRGFRLRLAAVDVHGLGGVCHWDGSTSFVRRCLISWGGVFGQSILLAAAFVTRLLLPLPILLNPWVDQVLGTLILTNLYMMAINLVPIPGFDGAEAWKLFGKNGLPAWWRMRKLKKSQPKGVVRAMPQRRRFISNNIDDDILENTPTSTKRPPPHMLN